MADRMRSLATYASDILALEEHIRVPLAAQRADGDFAKYPEAHRIVVRAHSLCERHIADLKAALQDLGGRELPAVATDAMRKTKAAYALRDDYTGLSLCVVSYAMLMTTAYAYENTDVSTLAERHLSDYAQVVMQISDAIPDVVVQDLQAAGVDADSVAVEESRTAIHAAWHSAGSPRTTIGTIESEAALNRSVSRSTYPTI